MVVVDEAAEGEEEESGKVATLRGKDGCWDDWCGRSASSPSCSSTVVVIIGVVVEDHENVWFLNMQKDISLVGIVEVDLQ